MLEQREELEGKVCELERVVQGLEAQRDQLEHDKFATQTSLEQLEAQHQKVGTTKLAESFSQCEEHSLPFLEGGWDAGCFFPSIAIMLNQLSLPL